MGVKVGEKGLDRYASPKQLDRVRKKIRESGAITLAILDLIPPPFPFTPFVLAAGALEVDPWTFFITLAGCRLARFGAETALALFYGRQIISWLNSPILNDIVIGCAVLAVLLTTVSLVKIFRTSGRPRQRHAPA
jgi:membrane protein DedA with SNARE-associated domain